MSKTISRRTLLASAAGTSLALAAVARPAQAAFEEAVATTRLQQAVDDRCGASLSHEQLIAEVEKLTGTLSDEEKRRVVAQLTCPVCGCSVASLF